MKNSLKNGINILQLSKKLKLSYPTVFKYVKQYKKLKSDMDIEEFIKNKLNESKLNSVKNLRVNQQKIKYSTETLTKYEKTMRILVLIIILETIILICLI